MNGSPHWRLAAHGVAMTIFALSVLAQEARFLQSVPEKLLWPAAPTSLSGAGKQALAGGQWVQAHPRLRQGKRFLLELGPGATWVVERDRLDELGKGDFVWTGHAVGHPFSRVTLSSRGGVISGVIDLAWQDGNEAYEIVPSPGGASLFAPSAGLGEASGCDMAVASTSFAALEESGGASPLSPAMVDVLVVYTPATRARYGQAGAEAMIQQAIADANTAYQNSQVYLTVRLVQMAEVAYTETGIMGDALTRLRTPGDGFMDEVHAWRDAYGADLVVLVDEDTSACGQGYLMSSVGPSFASYAFSVVNSGCLSGFSMAHEMGHNMGSHHDRANAVGSPAFPYSYGYVNCASDGTGFRTIMAYPCGIVPRLNYFSNPDVLVNGLPAGVDYETDPANAADNARSLNATAPVVAAFRSGAPQPPTAPTDLSAASAGATALTLQWTDASSDETGFAVERSLEGSVWSEIATLPSGTTSFLDDALQTGTAYFYRVRAYNAAGYSPYSNVASAVPAEAPPPAPTNLEATAVSASQIDLAWTDASANETGFEMERSLDGATWTFLLSVPANTRSHQDLGLAANTTYHYRVRAVNGAGVSPFCSPAAATTTGASVATVTLFSIGAEDGFILESSETSEIGGAVYGGYTATGALRGGDNYQDRQYRTIVSFDTSVVPEGVTLISATLRLKRSNVTGTDPFTTHGACWVDIRSGGFEGSTALAIQDFEAAADGVRVASLSQALTDGAWCEGPLAVGGLAAVNTTGRTQFRVYFASGDNDDNSTDYLGWYSGENSVNDNRPQLVVQYVAGTPQPPAAPSALTASAVSAAQIRLEWTDNADNETGVEIERSANLSAWAAIASLGADATIYDDVGVSAGVTYHYRVRAFNGAGGSAWSNLASATPQAPAIVTLTLESIGAHDGFVLEKSETSEIGSNAYPSYSDTGAIRAGDTYQDRQYRGLVSFDTSGIPDGATVVSATLRLRRGSVSGTNPFLTHGACWVDVASGGFNGSTSLTKEDFQAVAGASRVARLGDAANDGDWSEGSLDGTGLGYVNKTGITQFRIAFDLGDNDDRGTDYLGWYSGEHSVAANRPQLVIEYSP